jgi:hypothetical protein
MNGMCTAVTQAPSGHHGFAKCNSAAQYHQHLKHFFGSTSTPTAR